MAVIRYVIGGATWLVREREKQKLIFCNSYSVNGRKCILPDLPLYVPNQPCGATYNIPNHSHDKSALICSSEATKHSKSTNIRTFVLN